jgi:hypothetical protein
VCPHYPKAASYEKAHPLPAPASSLFSANNNLYSFVLIGVPFHVAWLPNRPIKVACGVIWGSLWEVQGSATINNEYSAAIDWQALVVAYSELYE